MTGDRIAEKACTKCGSRLSLSAFPRDGSKKSGRSSACSKCRAQHKARRYAQDSAFADRERELARARTRMRPPAKKLEAVKAWKQRHPDTVNEMHRRERAALPDYYVKRLLAAGTAVAGVEYPQALIEAKRLQIAIHRIVTERKSNA